MYLTIKDTESKFGLTELLIEDFGKTTKLKARELSIMWTEIYLKERGEMIRQMEWEFTFIQTEQNMKVFG